MEEKILVLTDSIRSAEAKLAYLSQKRQELQKELGNVQSAIAYQEHTRDEAKLSLSKWHEVDSEQGLLLDEVKKLRAEVHRVNESCLLSGMVLGRENGPELIAPLRSDIKPKMLDDLVAQRASITRKIEELEAEVPG